MREGGTHSRERGSVGGSLSPLGTKGIGRTDREQISREGPDLRTCELRELSHWSDLPSDISVLLNMNSDSILKCAKYAFWRGHGGLVGLRVGVNVNPGSRCVHDRGGKIL